MGAVSHLDPVVGEGLKSCLGRAIPQWQPSSRQQSKLKLATDSAALIDLAINVKTPVPTSLVSCLPGSI